MRLRTHRTVQRRLHQPPGLARSDRIRRQQQRRARVVLSDGHRFRYGSGQHRRRRHAVCGGRQGRSHIGGALSEPLRAQGNRLAASRSGGGLAPRWTRAHRHGNHRFRRALHSRLAAPRLAARCAGKSARTPMSTLTLRRPDDWHVHLRDGAALAAVVNFTAERFGRAIVMPNLKPPITTAALARAYRERIMAALPRSARFEPLLTLYLTDTTLPDEIDRARAAGFIHGVKLYPAGATTHSDAGVTDIKQVYGVLAHLEKVGMPLLVHGESPQAEVDVFDRETHFIDAVLEPLLERFPKLKVVFEHITTARAVQFVNATRAGVAATITPQHLLHNRNAIFLRGIRPHYYCLPILKREQDRQALLEAATSGNPRYFLGTDSAPHEQRSKENACGCAGMFTAHAALELYAEAFESVGRLERLEAFASHFGADFYGLPRHSDTITLIKEPWVPPESYAFAGGTLVPYRGGETVGWRLAPEEPA